MADQKITALTLVTPTNDDLVPVVDDPAGSPVTKKATIASILALAPVTVTFVTVDVPEANLEVCNTTPFTLVAAPGANKVIMPIAWWPEFSITTVYANLPTWTLRYNGIALDILMTHTMTTNATVDTKLIIGVGNNPQFQQVLYGANDPRNKALVLRSSADLSGAGVATAKIHLVYSVGNTY